VLTGYEVKIITQAAAKGSSSANKGILDYDLHQCEAIVNAGNIDGKFGGGISGVIGDATGKKEAINIEVANLLDDY
jgi:hypothetical protein